MAAQQPQITTLIIPEEKKKSLNIKGVIAKYLYHWPLFVLGLSLALSAAVAYLHFAKPTYPITATLIIKDDKKAPDQQSALSEIDLVNSSKLIENEMEVLKSNRLISKVIKELGLGTAYKEKAGLRSFDLYKNSPVKLTLLSSNVTPPREAIKPDKSEISIIIKDKNTFILKKEGEQTKEYAFNTPITYTWGTWKLEPTDLLPQYTDAKIEIAVLDTQQLALDLQKAIDVSLSNKLATTVSLTLEDQVAQRGKDILNQIISDYNSTGTKENETSAKATLAFLDSRIDSLSAGLNVTEAGIEGFKSSRGLTDIAAESKINLENRQENDRSLNEVNVKLNIIDGIENYVNSSKSGQPPTTMGIADPALNSLIENLSRLQLQRDKLLAIAPETNPDFDPINRQIASTRAAIKESVANIKSSLLNTRSKLQSFSSGFETSIKEVPAQERQLESIKRQQEVKASLYTYLLQKREELAANYANIITKDQVVDAAYAGKAKVPRKAIALAVALLLGICMPAGLIYGRENLRSTIVDVKEIRKGLDIPVIAEISFEKSQALISIKTDGTNEISEQLRTLRTNLHNLYGDRTSGRVTLVTSSVPAEGKSFISGNLSVTLAHTERKTVLLEMDLRRPKIRENFSMEVKGPGITEFLNGKATLQQIVHQSELDPNLYIIGSGAIENNPSELLEKEQLKNLIAILRKTYDDIIIDSPPVHLVPDAMILSRLTDITLYIMKQGHTDRAEIDFLKEINNKKQLSNIQIVFNGVERDKYGYGYKHNTSYYSKVTKKTIFTDFWKRF